MQFSWGGPWRYGILGMPDRIAVVCPRCSAEAAFVPPFRFRPDVDGTAIDEEKSVRVFDRIVDFERCFPWRDPDNPYRPGFGGRYRVSGPSARVPIFGLLKCPECALLRKHRLAWPDDAFYRTVVDGKLLWAWDRGTMMEIRSHVASELREKRRNPFLRYLPRTFLLAKHRQDVVRAIDKLLGGAADDRRPQPRRPNKARG